MSAPTHAERHGDANADVNRKIDPQTLEVAAAGPSPHVLTGYPPHNRPWSLSVAQRQLCRFCDTLDSRCGLRSAFDMAFCTPRNGLMCGVVVGSLSGTVAPVISAEPFSMLDGQSLRHFLGAQGCSGATLTK